MIKDRLTTMFLGVATVVIVATLIFGFVKIGSPAHQRDLAADTKRINDLTTIAQNIYSYMNPPQKVNQTLTPPIKKLPLTLDALPQLYPQNLKDPVTNTPYEYIPHEGTKYELCATFAITVSPNDAANQPYYYGPKVFMTHPSGRYCFALDASQTPYEYNSPVSRAPIPVPVPAN